MFPDMQPYMTLKEYLDHHRLSLKAFGDQCGISPATVLRARDGIVLPNRKTMRAIVEATGGQVTVDDLVSADEKACNNKKEIAE